MYKNASVKFEAFSNMLNEIHFKLLIEPEKEFRFTESQQEDFNKIFPDQVQEFYNATGNEGVSIVMRMGIMFFRIAMVLTIIRNRESEVLICEDKDFEAAKLMVECLTNHSLAVYSNLSHENEPAGKDISSTDILKKLPPEFDANKAIEALKEHYGISKRTGFRFLKTLCSDGRIEKIKLGRYRIKSNN
jgi:hypothetical protein